MRNIGQERIRSIEVPLPPLQELKRIVDEVDFQLSIVDEIDKTLDRKLKQSEKLRQSILKQAFEGKLVPQNDSDEPASVLLERIRSKKRQAEIEGKAKKKVRPKKKKTIKNKQLKLVEVPSKQEAT